MLPKVGPLVSALVAKAILVPQLKELNHIAADRSSTPAERQQILAAIRALPETGFDWGAAFRREEDGQVLTVDQMSHAENLAELLSIHDWHADARSIHLGCHPRQMCRVFAERWVEW